MRNPLSSLLALLMCVAALGAAEWRQLPLTKDGKIHPDWGFTGYGKFVVEDGAIRTDPDTKGLGLLVYKKEKLGNCQFRLVFKAKDARSNSGFYVRVADGILKQFDQPGAAFERDAAGKPTDASEEKVKASSEREEGPWYAVHQGYEVQIAGGSTGSIYSLANTAVDSKDAHGKWRTMVITLEGDRIDVELDGKQASSVDTSRKDLPPRNIYHAPKREPKRPEAGYIGLQTHDPGDIVWFKEISVRPLAGAKK